METSLRKHGTQNNRHDRGKDKMLLRMDDESRRSRVMGKADGKGPSARRSRNPCNLEDRFLVTCQGNIRRWGLAILFASIKEVVRPGGMHKIRLAMNNYRRLIDMGAK